jgi:hypothetical protein
LVIPNGRCAVLMRAAQVFLIYGRQESSGGGGQEGFTGRADIGYDHGYDGEVFYLGLALDPAYIEGWVEGCLERIGEDHPEEEQLFRDLWEDDTQRQMVIDCLKADCEVRTRRPQGLLT